MAIFTNKEGQMAMLLLPLHVYSKRKPQFMTRCICYLNKCFVSDILTKNEKVQTLSHKVNFCVSHTLWVFSKSVANARGRSGESIKNMEKTVGSFEKWSLTREVALERVLKTWKKRLVLSKNGR